MGGALAAVRGVWLVGVSHPTEPGGGPAIPCKTPPMVKIHVTSVLVDDQARALAFYTEQLGFQLRHDVPLGKYRWLTVVSPNDPDGVELLLEPDAHPAAKQYKAALVADGIPVATFQVADVQAEYDRLSKLGVRFTQEPTQMGPVTTAVLDDTCGNLIQLVTPPNL